MSNSRLSFIIFYIFKIINRHYGCNNFLPLVPKSNLGIRRKDAKRAKNFPVLINYNPTTINIRLRSIRAILNYLHDKNAGLKGKSIHCLRHTFALRKLVERGNISVVKELLGHSSVKVTEIYTQFPRPFLQQIFEKQRNEVDKKQMVAA